MSSIKATTFRILGVDIEFPFEPYGIQKGMFGKLITTLTNKEHLLLESPTGTGKTLVLLCSALSWQTKSKELNHPLISARLRRKLIELRRAQLENKPCSCGRRPSRNELDELKEAKENNVKKGRKCSDEFDNDSSCLKKPKFESEDLKSSPYFDKKKPNKIDDDNIIIIDDDVIIIDDNKCNLKLEDRPPCDNCNALKAEEIFTDEMSDDAPTSKLTTKIPRIYYGTRTHKQITQVIRELNKTPYKKNLRMCILSSRERTCINPDVKDLPSRNDKCQELIKVKASMFSKKNRDEGCPYHPDSSYVQAQFGTINDEFKSKAWDIEEASSFGLEHMACPYYGVRSLQEAADITFCPYNYLLDPNIRNSLNINLKGAIIIIDEAHNIEDICRESASFVIDTTQIDDIIDTIQSAATHCVQGSKITDAYDFFKDRLLTVKSYLQKFQFTETEKGFPKEFIARRVMNHHDMLLALRQVRLGPESLQEVRDNLKVLKGDDDEEQTKKSEDKEGPALSFNQLSFLVQLEMTLNFMYSKNNKYINDFRLVVTEFSEQDFNRFKSASASKFTNGDKHLWQLSLLCMNPGVTFEQVAGKAWSIIVASGTLSPIESLKSELGCEFKNDFEGAHVVPPEQIFATILSQGPDRGDLNCAYKNSQRLPFQDEVGSIVRDVCKTVPNGVLCFFPSYDRMETFYKRWFDKGYIKEIQRAGKKLFRERKNLSVEDFEKELKNYNALAKTKGALLFAVFRGKVSEGIDFADNAARAVITIGIPYPNIKEITVDLKRSYNDETRRIKPQLMTGGDWYASQGFRALNQALGRCIRHKGDWGAIIMIDSRLKQSFSMNSISKWLRQVMKLPNEYRQIVPSLQTFVEDRMKTQTLAPIAEFDLIEPQIEEQEDCFSD